MSKKLNQESILEYECEHKGKLLNAYPCGYLVYLYNNVYNLPKDLERWLEDNIEDIEKAAGMGSTLNSYFQK